MDERWFGHTFQMFDATDENDFEVAIYGGFTWGILTTMKSGVLTSVHILGWGMPDRMAAEIVAP